MPLTTVSAIASISTRAPDGSSAISTVERAGGVVADVRRVDLVHPREVARSVRKTVVFTSLSKPLPAASRIAPQVRAAPARSAPGSSHRRSRSWSGPQRDLARDEDEIAVRLIACEYGAPWNGAGAPRCGRPPSRPSATPFGCAAARLGERDAERLEDRLEHVLGVACPRAGARAASAPRRLRARRGSARRCRLASPRDARRGEVDVRDEQRPARRLERDVRERLVGRHDGRAGPRRPSARSGSRERLAERAARPRRPPASAAPGCDLEREVERRRSARAAPSRWSSTGSPVATFAVAGAVHGRRGRRSAPQPSPRSQPSRRRLSAALSRRRARSCAPSARSRSSMRS